MLKVPRLFPNDQSQYAVVYQYWPQMEGAPVHKQPFIPILQSIATVRHYSPKVAIYVIDYSEKEGTWGDYSRRFNFTVIR